VRTVYRSDLAAAHRNLGNLLWSQGKTDQALIETTQALDILRQLVSDFPQRPAYQKILADTHNSLGSVLASHGKLEEAQTNYVTARELFQHLVDDHSDVIEYQQLLGITIGNLGWVSTELQDWSGARKLYEQAIPHLRKAHQANPKNNVCLRALGNQFQSLAETAIRLGDHAAAAEAASSMAETGRDRGQDCYYAACFLARCVPIAESDLPDANELGRALRQRYVQLVVEMLRTAVKYEGVRRLPNENEIFELLQQEPEVVRLLSNWPAR